MVFAQCWETVLINRDARKGQLERIGVGANGVRPGHWLLGVLPYAPTGNCDFFDDHYKGTACRAPPELIHSTHFPLN